MNVRDHVRKLRSALERCAPPACSGHTVSRQNVAVKKKESGVKPLCERCGWHELACGSRYGAVPGRKNISEDGSSCPWFEDLKAMGRSWSGFP